MENKEKLPLAVRAQKCSFLGTTKPGETTEIAFEIVSTRNEKALLEIISMPLMDSAFKELALTRVMLLKLSQKEIRDSTVKLKVHQNLFPEEILEKFPDKEQVDLPFGKVIKKGDYLFIFVSSTHFVDSIVRVILDSTDYFSGN